MHRDHVRTYAPIRSRFLLAFGVKTQGDHLIYRKIPIISFWSKGFLEKKFFRGLYSGGGGGLIQGRIFVF